MRPIAALALALLTHTLHAQPIVVDGDFGDWPAQAASVADPAGDANGQLDVTELAGVVEGSTLHLSLSIAEPFNLQAGGEAEPDLALVIDGGAGPVIEIRFRNRTAIRRDTGVTLTWDAVRYASAPTVAAERFEIRLDLAGLGGVADHAVKVSLEGSDPLGAPLTIQEADRPAPPVASPSLPLRHHDHDLRVASLNTYRTGLFTPEQADPLARLLVAAEADIYLLQEEYNSNQTQIEDLFNKIIPQAEGSRWQAHKRGDCAIVARVPLKALPNHDPSYAAAAVFTGQGPLVVISKHPKCCGSLGSTEDLRRIEQAGLIARLVNEIRAGTHGADLTDAPVIIGGDWNLVGSRTPLDMLTDPQLPNIAELTIENRGRSDVSTWRELDGLGFPPGRLDLIVYDASRLEPLHAEAFDSEFAAPEWLEQFGVERADSRASDHLLLIADFLFRP